MLAENQWKSVKASTGISPATYGTIRYLAHDPSAQRDVLTAEFLPPAFERDLLPVVVETLSGEPLKRYSNFGLDFYNSSEIDPAYVSNRLAGAFQKISGVKDLARTIGALLIALHVVKPTGPEYDVSYSDPILPFSIFVSIDKVDQAMGDLRLAESILHECMHLQLTLIEEAVPLISGTSERYYSPWQRTMRPSRGVLHGIYVFRVIQDFYLTLLAMKPSVAEEDYLSRRIESIEEEVATVSDFSISRDLTEAGKSFSATLLAP